MDKSDLLLESLDIARTRISQFQFCIGKVAENQEDMFAESEAVTM